MPTSQSNLPWAAVSAFVVMWFHNKTLLITVTLAITGAGIVAILLHIATPRIVVSAVAPDGTEFCIIQSCNWNAELFNTSCYYRKPGGQWGWFYYDHQDGYWGNGHSEIDAHAKRISVYRGGVVTATFDWETETFHLLRKGFPHRTNVGTETRMPAGWSPR